MKQDTILKFRPNIHPALWGNESWEVSVHPSGPSVIEWGQSLQKWGQSLPKWGQSLPERGQSLRDVVPDFPLLVKIIDAKTRLSVQVHPNEETRKVTGGDPKTEMWVLLEDGVIYAGLKPGTGPAEIEAAVKSGRFEELLVRHEAKKGQSFFIPGGLVHAIGDNTLIYEVQQSSDTTFRLYDWNRVGKDGKPRELHVEKSLQAIDYTLPVPVAQKDIRCPFFDFRQIALDGKLELPASAGCTVLFAAEGAFTVNGVEVANRTSVLVAPDVPIALEGDAVVFRTIYM